MPDVDRRPAVDRRDRALAVLVAMTFPSLLAVIVGFDKSGNPIVNDPAAASNDDVQRTYLRAQLESVWLRYSGGTVYLIFPTGYAQPYK